jgi:hypothetical protein
MSELLQKLEKKLASKKIERDRLDAEIAELEIAARVLRGLMEDGQSASGNGTSSSIGQSLPPPPLDPKDKGEDPRADLAGTTILEAATRILQDHDGPLHYRVIALLAHERGYRSPRDTEPETVATSFSQMLRRASQLGDRVVATGGGIFRLRQPRDDETETGDREE